MHNRKFQLLFLGIEGDSYELALRKTAIVERFGLSQAKARVLFSGKPIVVKRNLDAEKAIRYKQIIDGLGGITRIEPMQPSAVVPKREDSVERRKHERRQTRDRRSHMRVRAIDTNRRRNKGRRASDHYRAS